MTKIEDKNKKQTNVIGDSQQSDFMKEIDRSGSGARANEIMSDIMK